DVHDVVAMFELQRIDDVLTTRCELLDNALVAADGATVELVVSEDGESRLRNLEAGFDRALHERGDPCLGCFDERVHDSCGQAAVGKHISGTVDQACAGGDHHHPPAL